MKYEPNIQVETVLSAFGASCAVGGVLRSWIVSSGGDQVPQRGDMLAKAMETVGNEGVITIEEAKSLATEMDVVEGMQFDRGYISPYFVTNAFWADRRDFFRLGLGDERRPIVPWRPPRRGPGT
jgi:hypothetical protein